MERLLAYARSDGTARALTLDMYMPDMDVADETAKKHVQHSLALAEQFLAEHSQGELPCFHVEVLCQFPTLCTTPCVRTQALLCLARQLTSCAFVGFVGAGCCQPGVDLQRLPVQREGERRIERSIRRC